MNIPYIVNSNGIVLFIDGRPIDINNTDIRYSDILNAAVSNNESRLLSLINKSEDEIIVDEIKATVTNSEYFGDLEIITSSDGKATVKYKTIELPDCLRDKLISLYREGCTDFSHYYMFCEKLLANPSDNSREQLYQFLDTRNLPITQDGNFIAYKGLDHNMISIHGNLKTTVLSGERLCDGRIKNNIGDIIRVRVADVETNPDVACSTGLHVGSYAYARNFGNIVVAVEVNPAHVISVPNDCNYGKCRVSEYKVLNVVTSTYNTADVIVNDDATVSETENVARITETSETVLNRDNNYEQYREAIDRNIRNHMVDVDDDKVRVMPYEDGVTYDATYPEATTIAQLCSSVGRNDNINSSTMMNILLTLGYTLKLNNSVGKTIVVF